jgi:uncharacterized membrane protein
MNTSKYSHDDAALAPELDELKLPDKPDGPAGAAMVAAGAGTFVLGLFTLLNELSTGVNKLLNAFDTGGVGPLSGKSILASIAFIVVLGALWALWRDKDVDLKKMFWIGIGLGVVGALLTFPPIFAAGH